MIKVTPFFLLLILLSCSGKKKENVDHTQYANTRVYAFMKDFVSRNPNMYKDEASTKKAQKEFFAEFYKKMKHDSLLESIPFRYTHYSVATTTASFVTKLCDKDSTFSLYLFLMVNMAPEGIPRFGLELEKRYFIKGEYHRWCDDRVDMAKNVDTVPLEDIEGYYPTPDFFHVRMHQLTIRNLETIVLAKTP